MQGCSSESERPLGGSGWRLVNLSWVMHPDPNREMSFSYVKELIHAILHNFRHTIEPRMVSPMLGGVFGQRESQEAVSCDAFI